MMVQTRKSSRSSEARLPFKSEGSQSLHEGGMQGKGEDLIDAPPEGQFDFSYRPGYQEAPAKSGYFPGRREMTNRAEEVEKACPKKKSPRKRRGSPQLKERTKRASIQREKTYSDVGSSLLGSRRKKTHRYQQEKRGIERKR